MNARSSGTRHNLPLPIPEADGQDRQAVRQAAPDQRLPFQESVPEIQIGPTSASSIVQAAVAILLPVKSGILP